MKAPAPTRPSEDSVDVLQVARLCSQSQDGTERLFGAAEGWLLFLMNLLG